MADGVTTQSSTLATIPASTVIATDDAGAAGHVQIVKLGVSADATATPIPATADGLLVNLGTNNDVSVSGTVTVDASGTAVPITDNAGSLTVDDGGTTLSIDDGAGSITVDGTVAVSGTVTVDASGAAVPVTDNGGSLTVDGTVAVSSSALPTGAATAANQATVIGHLDGVEGLLATIDADTGTLATTGGGTETGALRVTVASDSTGVLSVDDNGSSLSVDDAGGALTVDNAGTFATQPAGSVAHDAVGTSVNPVLAGGYASAAAPASVSADGDAVRAWHLRNGAQATVVTAAGALIGGDATNGLDVDVTRVIPGTSATHLGKAEDAAHSSGDTGVMALAVRTDSAAARAGTDGDYIPLTTDSAGRLWVNASGAAVPITDNAGSITVDNAGTFAVQAAQSGSWSASVQGDVADDAADSGNPVKIGGKYAATPPTYTDGDRTTIQTDTRGSQAVILRRPDSSASLAVTDDDGQATATTYGLLARASLFNGTTWDRMRGDTTNGLDVDVTRSALPTGASTLAEQQTQSTSLSAIATDAAAIEGLLATIDADTGGILTAVQTLDNAISGSEMQVDVVASLPAGTNNIGDVDVLTTVLPTVNTTAAVTSVADTATSTTLLSSSADRKGFRIHNTSSAVLYVKYGTTASATDFTARLGQHDYLEENFYSGRVDGIWASDPGDGAALVTSLSA